MTRVYTTECSLRSTVLKLFLLPASDEVKTQSLPIIPYPGLAVRLQWLGCCFRRFVVKSSLHSRHDFRSYQIVFFYLTCKPRRHCVKLACLRLLFLSKEIMMNCTMNSLRASFSKMINELLKQNVISRYSEGLHNIDP